MLLVSNIILSILVLLLGMYTFYVLPKLEAAKQERLKHSFEPDHQLVPGKKVYYVSKDLERISVTKLLRLEAYEEAGMVRLRAITTSSITTGMNPVAMYKGKKALEDVGALIVAKHMGINKWYDVYHPVTYQLFPTREEANEFRTKKLHEAMENKLVKYEEMLKIEA